MGPYIPYLGIYTEVVINCWKVIYQPIQHPYENHNNRIVLILDISITIDYYYCNKVLKSPWGNTNKVMYVCRMTSSNCGALWLLFGLELI